MTAPQPIEKPADDPRISAALAKIESLLTPGETLGAYAVQRRYKALTHRLAIVATTSGRLIILNRGLLGGFKMTDVRWQDLANAQIDEGIFSSTLRTPREPDAAPETGRRAMVTSPARAVPMAPVALWPERIKTLRHVARTCPPSRRAHQALPSWVVHAARR